MIESENHWNDGCGAPATLAILAGGEGSRMGRSKTELSLSGMPLLEYLHGRLDWRGPTMIVTAPGRERPVGAGVFDREVTDPVAGAGPLRGMLTALEQARTPLLVAAALDMPGIARLQLNWLCGQLDTAPERAGVLLRRGGLLEPLPCAFRVDAAAPLVRAALDAGRRSVRSLLEVSDFVAVDAPADWGDDVWTNLNDPAAWEAYVRSVRQV